MTANMGIIRFMAERVITENDLRNQNSLPISKRKSPAKPVRVALCGKAITIIYEIQQSEMFPNGSLWHKAEVMEFR